jgi:tetratricopeptide (TPR) repeat protein
MVQSTRTRDRLIEAIVAPLGFYVLALLIVEAFIGTVMISRNLDERFVFVGIGMFVLVVVVVTVLVWMKPGHLTFDKMAHLEMERIKGELSREVHRNTQLEAHLRNALSYRSQKRYIEAIALYERALNLDGRNEEALVGRAVSQSFAQPDDLEGPIRALEDVLERNPNCSLALYNLACLHRLSSGYAEDQWLDELKRAVTISPELKDFARRDEDFKEFWEDSRFRAIVRISNA